MNAVVWITLATGLLMMTVAKLSVVRMVQEINRRREPRNWVSLAWWPNYRDRQVMKTYHSILPQGRLNIIYISCMAGGMVVLLLALIFASHATI